MVGAKGCWHGGGITIPCRAIAVLALVRCWAQPGRTDLEPDVHNTARAKICCRQTWRARCWAGPRADFLVDAAASCLGVALEPGLHMCRQPISRGRRLQFSGQDPGSRISVLSVALRD